MEFSKLTICRQDVIVVSDTEEEPNGVNLKKKKKLKRKTTCIRNVKLTTMTVNRIVPYCYRQRCRNGHHYHRQTSKNTKYQKQNSSAEIKQTKNAASTKNILCGSEKKDDDIKPVLTRDLYSPITVTSGSDIYENISSSSFNPLSSDSDELDDLINLTRKRMKNNNEIFNKYPCRKSVSASTAQDDYQNISSNDEVFDGSIHSMDTEVLYHVDSVPSPQINSEHRNPVHLKRNMNNNIEPMLLCSGSNQDSNDLIQKKIPRLSTEDNNNSLSPLYEISGKVFMEHYLNTNLI